MYADAREAMKTGDMLLWTSRTVLGWLIRLKKPDAQDMERIRAVHPEIPDDYNPNHVSSVIRLSEYEGEERHRYCLEALEHGFVLNRLSRRMESFDGDVWWFPLKSDFDPRRTDIGRNLLSYVGVPYDYGSLFRNILGHVSADARRLFCSEAYYISLGLSGTAPRPNELLGLGIFGRGVKIK